MTGEPLISLADTAQLLGIPVNTLRDWRKHHRGPRGYRLGRHVNFRPSEVEAWLQQQREPEHLTAVHTQTAGRPVGGQGVRRTTRNRERSTA